MLIYISPYFFYLPFYFLNLLFAETCCQQRYYLARELMLLDREEKVGVELMLLDREEKVGVELMLLDREEKVFR